LHAIPDGGTRPRTTRARPQDVARLHAPQRPWLAPPGARRVRRARAGPDEDRIATPGGATLGVRVLPGRSGRSASGRGRSARRAAGVMPQTFGTITVSDGISMGTEGMKYSLVSREVIADSIETACNAQSMDGLLVVGGCDKNMPGAMIAIARMDIPAVFVYGGT